MECQLTARLGSAPAEVHRTGDEDALVGEHFLLVITDDGHVLQLGAVLTAEVKLGSRKVFFRPSVRELEIFHGVFLTMPRLLLLLLLRRSPIFTYFGPTS